MLYSWTLLARVTIIIRMPYHYIYPRNTRHTARPETQNLYVCMCLCAFLLLSAQTRRRAEPFCNDHGAPMIESYWIVSDRFWSSHDAVERRNKRKQRGSVFIYFGVRWLALFCAFIMGRVLLCVRHERVTRTVRERQDENYVDKYFLWLREGSNRRKKSQWKATSKKWNRR